MRLTLAILVATGAVGVVLLTSHLRGTYRAAQVGWPAHAVAAVAAFVTFTAALIREGVRNGWVLVAYMLLLAAALLGVIVSASKEDQHVPVRLLLLHASVGAAAIGLFAVAIG